MSDLQYKGFNVPVGSKYRQKKRKSSYNLEGFVGKVSGFLKVTGALEHPARLQCECECGNTRTVEVYIWNRGAATSCGKNCPIAHPKDTTKALQRTDDRVSKWAKRALSEAKAHNNWKGFAVHAYETKFRVSAYPKAPGQGRSPKCNSDTMVGIYTMDAPVEYIKDDIKTFLDLKAASETGRTW